MPQKLFVAELLRVEDGLLTFTLNFEAINECQTASSSCVLDISVNHLELALLLLHRPDIALELIEALVQAVDLRRRGIGCFLGFLLAQIHDVGCDLNVDQVRDQIELLLELFFGVDGEVRHVLHAEVVRDVRVELA